MGIFKADIDPKELERIEREIEKRIEERKAKYGDYVAKEEAIARQVLSYRNIEMEDIPYELFMARQYSRLFPEGKLGTKTKFAGIRRFFRRLVRRFMRPQVVFNEFITGAVDDLNRKIVELEDKVKSLEARRTDNPGGERKK